MIKIFSAVLQPTGTTNSNGDYCEYQWAECDTEDTNYTDASQYVNEIILENDIDIIEGITVHNRPAGAIIVGESGAPNAMYWHEDVYWGGKRPGSGRPSTGRKRHNFYITDVEAEQIKKLIDDIRKPSE